MKRIIAASALIITLLLSFAGCQVYDQSTNGVVYTAMPKDGVETREDLVKDITKVLDLFESDLARLKELITDPAEFEEAQVNLTKEAKSDLITIARKFDPAYTDIIDPAAGDQPSNYKSIAFIAAEIMVLWDVVYPVKWDFKRK